jgi:hypothetical protein
MFSTEWKQIGQSSKRLANQGDIPQYFETPKVLAAWIFYSMGAQMMPFSTIMCKKSDLMYSWQWTFPVRLNNEFYTHEKS